METEELSVLKNEVNTLDKKLSELTSEDLAQVDGGRQFDPGMGIQWDDPRCLHAVAWCCSFRNSFPGCYIFSQAEKEQVLAFCGQFCHYMSEEAFDLNMAKSTYISMSAVVSLHTMTPAAWGAWIAFTQVFNSIIV